MDNRSQFTMYESVYKALQKIRKKSDKADAYDMICAYALYNLEPNLDNASDSVAIAFELIRPVLDSARKKAANGKLGGSKPKANGKQSASKKEKENEYEKEVEIEKEKENEIEIEYKCNNRSGSNAGVDDERIVSIAKNLFERYVGRLPTGMDCDLTYNRIVFGGQVNENAIGLLEYAFEASHKAGKPGNWNYITAVLDRCSLQCIYTADEARRRDEAGDDA